MPVYCWECENCAEHTKKFASMAECKNAPTCPKCSQHMTRDYHAEHYGHVPGGTFPYVTTHLDGTPIEVRSAGHLAELCKKHGKVLRDDAGYIEQDMHIEKYTDRNGNLAVRPVYRSGSGDGEGKRRWI